MNIPQNTATKKPISIATQSIVAKKLRITITPSYGLARPVVPDRAAGLGGRVMRCATSLGGLGTAIELLAADLPIAA